MHNAYFWIIYENEPIGIGSLLKLLKNIKQLLLNIHNREKKVYTRGLGKNGLRNSLLKGWVFSKMSSNS